MGNKLRSASGPFILPSIPAPVGLDTYMQTPQNLFTAFLPIYLFTFAAYWTSLNLNITESKWIKNVAPTLEHLFSPTFQPLSVSIHTHKYYKHL
jgi:hypothetical protein